MSSHMVLLVLSHMVSSYQYPEWWYINSNHADQNSPM